MMRLSFELFPPKSDDGLGRLTEVANRLAALGPEFISVTYGAGGSSRHRSFATIEAVRRSGAPIAAHLTCVGQSVADLTEVMATYQHLGIDRIVALRGDPPDGIDAPYRPHRSGYVRTADLVAAARPHFDVMVSAYPERHPQSPTLSHDLDVLAEKVDAGATRAITQMCFDHDAFARYLDAVRARRIDVEIVPGIFPIHSLPAVARFTARCGASIPSAVARRFDRFEDDPTATADIGAEFAAEQIRRLDLLGVEHVHLYTLNQADLALDVCGRISTSERARA